MRTQSLGSPCVSGSVPSYAEKKTGRHRSLPIRCLFLFLLLPGMASLQAQHNMVLYQMQHIPQSNLLNPGQIPLVKKYVGLPVISGLRLGAGSSEFMYNDLNSWLGESGEATDYFELNNRVTDGIGRMMLDAEVRLLSVGTRIGKGFASLDIGEVVYVSGRFSKPIFTLLNDLQEQPYTGGTPLMYDFSNLDLNGAYYHSFSLGYAHQFTSNLSFGGRFRWLQGVSGIWTDNNNLRLNNQTDGSFFEVLGQLNILTSGLTGDEDFNPLSSLFSSGNSGFAVDLGGVYQLNDQWEFSFSALNLGQISWKKQVDYAVVGDHLSFSNEDPDTFVEEWKTALDDQLDGDPANPNVRFTTPLPQRFMVAGRYYIRPNTSLGFVANTVFFNRSTDLAFTLSANSRLGKILGASVAATYNSYSPFNLGLGLSADLGPVQIYAIADNVPAALNWKKAKAVQAQVGINLVFGKMKRSDLLPEPPIAAIPADSLSMMDTLSMADTLHQNVMILDTAAVDSALAVQPEEILSIPVDSTSTIEELPEEEVGVKEIAADSLPTADTMLLDEAVEEEIVAEPVEQDIVEEVPIDSIPTTDTMLLDETAQEEMVTESEEEEIVEPTPAVIPEASVPPSPAALDEQAKWFVITAPALLREGPIYTSDVLSPLREGDKVEVVKKTGRYWWKVRFVDTVGFVRTQFLESIQGNGK